MIRIFFILHLVLLAPILFASENKEFSDWNVECDEGDPFDDTDEGTCLASSNGIRNNSRTVIFFIGDRGDEVYFQFFEVETETGHTISDMVEARIKLRVDKGSVIEKDATIQRKSAKYLAFTTTIENDEFIKSMTSGEKLSYKIEFNSPIPKLMGINVLDQISLDGFSETYDFLYDKVPGTFSHIEE